ncbi:SoxR reducing system RseC family protein [Hahella sp. HN01]|uniref:SoxR reducing system RseC family protein n=1 Tax=Hahella sp. HN01 TaxID=2847262 RepID=UPI001C1EB3C1|nr:SoxR reducing system RseC family protein [Hahella sp. HN01]MBU6953729.1 SoxR reducing system RseC family protein [Hahella sp. HN01]
MILETGKVVAVGDHEVWVRTTRESVCQSCSARKGCGSRLLNQMSDGASTQIKVAKTFDVDVGDEVEIGVAEQALLNASLLVYLAPLIAMIILAGVSQSLLHWPDLGVALAGLSGLGLGFVFVKILSSRLSCNPSYHPQLLRKLC